MQNYSILVGMNGAGLTNGLYLPPGGVVIQLVPYPYRVSVNNLALGELLRGGAGGGYTEWRNEHADLTVYDPSSSVATSNQ